MDSRFFVIFPLALEKSPFEKVTPTKKTTTHNQKSGTITKQPVFFDLVGEHLTN